jgi:hypothetical protein
MIVFLCVWFELALTLPMDMATSSDVVGEMEQTKGSNHDSSDR